MQSTNNSSPQSQETLSPGFLVGSFIEILCQTQVPGTLTVDNVENPFHLNHPPPISLPDFSERLQKYFACSAESFVVASLYLRRLYTVRPDLFSPRSAHKLLLAALTAAVKFTDDITCKQAHYARCGGIEVTELNTLEAKLISELKFVLYVKPEQYTEGTNILRHLADLAHSSRLAVAPGYDQSSQQNNHHGVHVRGSFS